MATISIGKAWEETLAFVKREGTLLFPVALVFLALPAVVLQLVAPEQMHPMAEVGPQQLPPAFIFSMLLVILIGMLGMLAIYALSLRPGISVAEALQLAVRRMPVLMGSMALLLAGFTVLFLILSLLGAVFVPAMGTTGAASVVVLMAAPVLLFVMVRLLLLYAILLNEPVGSVEAIRRGWRLTTGQFWKLFAFVMALVMLALIIQLVSRSLFGIAGGLIGGSALATLFAGLAVAIVNAVIQVYYLVMTSRIYRQLGG